MSLYQQERPGAGTSPSPLSSPVEPRIAIEGGTPLHGEVCVSGSKNASLAILAGSLLASEGVTTLRNLPRISDIRTMALILKAVGSAGRVFRRRYDAHDRRHPSDIARSPFRSRRSDARFVFSYWDRFLPEPDARLSRSRAAATSVRARSTCISRVLRALGARVDDSRGSVFAEAGAAGLSGARLYLDLPSVGATFNTMMAAALTEGVTLIENAAQEPDVEDLGNLLVCMGAQIHGHGTGMLTVEGVKKVCTWLRVHRDGGPYRGGDAGAGGGHHGRRRFPARREPGSPAPGQREDGRDRHERARKPRRNSRDGTLAKGTRLQATKLIASPHPGFPTDLQQPFTAALCLAEGTSIVTDSVYESRFRYLTELVKMGAHVEMARAERDRHRRSRF